VVFAAGERAATVFVFNQGGAPATYSVETVDRIMRPGGQIAPLADLSEADRTLALTRVALAGTALSDLAHRQRFPVSPAVELLRVDQGGENSAGRGFTAASARCSNGRRVPAH